jgi:hypothetical protein
MKTTQKLHKRIHKYKKKNTNTKQKYTRRNTYHTYQKTGTEKAQVRVRGCYK